MSEEEPLVRRSGLWSAFIGLTFRLLYQELALTYDVVSWLVSLGQWRQWQLAGLGYLKGERVLELAHGPGHMLVSLLEQGYRITGLDLSAMVVQLQTVGLGIISGSYVRQFPVVKTVGAT